MDKQYGLTKPYGTKKVEELPTWVNDVFKQLTEPPKPKKHPFEGVDDLLLNPKRIGLPK